MNGLDDIPVTVAPASIGELQITAILSEIRTLLQNLAAGGEGGTIDLRSLPLFPGDYEALQEALGHGEVEATVHALGPSTLRETAYAGVWWITHRNSAHEVMAELIEVNRCPAFLCTPDQDLEDSLERLSSEPIGNAPG